MSEGERGAGTEGAAPGTAEGAHGPAGPAVAGGPAGGWAIAAWSHELHSGPLAVLLGARPLVLFRDAHGRARALEDRCAHRGVPLSLGACRRGELVCRYHGWAFDGEGQLRDVPSRVDEPLPRVAVPAYATAEADGYVWVGGGGAPPTLGLAGYAWRRWRVRDPRPPAELAVALGGLAVDREQDGERVIMRIFAEGAGSRVEVLAGRRSWWPGSRWFHAGALPT